MIRRIACLFSSMLAAMVVFAPAAEAAPTWAPAATATIHPGVQTITSGGQCTANFIFYNASDVFIGQAAHCSSTSAATETNGCTANSLPLGTKVDVGGASQPGTLVYNSWLTMQALGETNANICAGNDFALVQLAPADAAKANPSIPHWGGPTGIGSSAPLLSLVYSYGNSELRLGITALSPKIGVGQGTVSGGWQHNTTLVTPGLPGDSGSALLDSNGRAIGVLSTLGVGVPGGVTNTFGDIAHELNYLNSHTSLGVTLATGTVPFNGSQLPLQL